MPVKLRLVSSCGARIFRKRALSAANSLSWVVRKAAKSACKSTSARRTSESPFTAVACEWPSRLCRSVNERRLPPRSVKESCRCGITIPRELEIAPREGGRELESSTMYPVPCTPREGGRELESLELEPLSSFMYLLAVVGVGSTTGVRLLSSMKPVSAHGFAHGRRSWMAKTQSPLLTYLLTYLLTCLLTFFLSYLLTYLHTYLLTYLRMGGGPGWRRPNLPA